MTWYRVGGGGLPPQIKTDMNNVLNKKMGTSGQTYPPTEWADDVNLMGLLEIKTASGAIASFADGADGVPVKSCSVSFTPSGGGGTPSAPVAITGVSGLAVTQLGKNLLNVNATDTTNGYVHYYYLLNTGETYYNADWSISEYIEVKENMSFTLSGVIGGNPSICFYDSNKTFLSGVKYGGANPKTVTSPSGAVYARVSFENSLKDTWQLEVGSTATTYSPYVTPVVTQDTFGQTIYGGTRDLVTDKASVTWGYIASYNGETLTGRWVSSMDTYVAGTTPTTGAEVAYELATPTEITGLTPHEIDTLYGDNNVYADTGNTSVEYRAMGTTNPGTLVTKTISDNGTYDPANDNADGYSQVTVNLPLGTKSITDNGTYNASSDGLKGFSSVTVSVSGGGSCERLMYARCVNNDQEEIPAMSNIEQGSNYSSYLSYDSSTKKFTVLQDFTGVVVAWVYAYRSYDINRPDGAFYLNSTLMLSYETTANAEGSTGGRSGIYNFKQGDTFWLYTPTRHGYPQQNCKVYRVSALSDNIFTFADEEE